MANWVVVGFLSRRDSTIVARHEVPGIMSKIFPSQRDDWTRSWLMFSLHPKSNQTSSDANFRREYPEYLAFPKRHEHSTIRRAVACSCRGSVSTTNISGTDNDFNRPSGTETLCIASQALRACRRLAPCPNPSRPSYPISPYPTGRLFGWRFSRHFVPGKASLERTVP